MRLLHNWLVENKTTYFNHLLHCPPCAKDETFGKFQFHVGQIEATRRNRERVGQENCDKKYNDKVGINVALSNQIDPFVTRAGRR